MREKWTKGCSAEEPCGSWQVRSAGGWKIGEARPEVDAGLQLESLLLDILIRRQG